MEILFWQLQDNKILLILAVALEQSFWSKKTTSLLRMPVILQFLLSEKKIIRIKVLAINRSVANLKSLWVNSLQSITSQTNLAKKNVFKKAMESWISLSLK